jgi:FkbM family methyltransferase
MISYAQNLEDVVLNRVFSGLAQGTYIDVGAAHPTFDSVTKSFYDRGWRGVNIEPRDAECRLLIDHRPKDHNLNIGIADVPGQAAFFEIIASWIDSSISDGGGLSTFDPEVAGEHSQKPGVQVIQHQREVRTLGQLVREQKIQDVSFLKVDVEGWERQVLNGMDWDFCRPRVVLVESTLPTTSVSNHDDWEELLTQQDYSFTLFDGLNRFYLREEDEALRPLIDVSANVLDDYTTHRCREMSELVLKLGAEQTVAANGLADLSEIISTLKANRHHLISKVDSKSLELGLKLATKLSRMKRRLGIAA